MPAGAGLTALLRANWWLYLALHIVGGVVLVYLGVTAWRSARRWLSRAAIRRRLERALGATLIALGLDLAAATR